MAIWQLLALGVVLALNNSLAAVALGSANMNRWRQAGIAVVFGIFEALMPVLGVWIGRSLAVGIGHRAHLVGVAVLALTGLYSLVKRDDPEPSLGSNRRAHAAKVLLYAVILSLDNLAVGFSLGLFSVSVGVAAVIFGSVSLVMTFVGLEVGRLLRKAVSLSVDRFAGAALLAAACLMLFV